MISMSNIFCFRYIGCLLLGFDVLFSKFPDAFKSWSKVCGILAAKISWLDFRYNETRVRKHLLATFLWLNFYFVSVFLSCLFF